METDAHQSMKLGAPVGEPIASRRARQLLGIRRQKLEAEQSCRVVFASTGLCSTQIFVTDVAEKLVAPHTGDLCKQGYEMRLVFVQCAQHISSSHCFAEFALPIA
jgi:hypothetical protein